VTVIIVFPSPVLFGSGRGRPGAARAAMAEVPIDPWRRCLVRGARQISVRHADGRSTGLCPDRRVILSILREEGEHHPGMVLAEF
jgi:hypothetical protein